MKTIAVIHGPNLDQLAKREKDIYGGLSLETLNQQLKTKADDLGLDLRFFQSNHEGAIIEEIHALLALDVAGLVINPAAYTHSSVAIRDALSMLTIPIVEVHLSNIHAREAFRSTSLTAAVVTGQIAGFGVKSYEMALQAFL